MRKVAVLLWLMMCPAWGQGTQQFKNFIGGLPTATTPVTGDKMYILQGGVNKSISAVGIGGITAGQCASPFQFIPATEWTAIEAGTSTYDTTSSLNSLFASGAQCVSFQPGLYNITSAVAVPSNIVIYGNWAEIKAANAGWLQSTNPTFGMLNLFQQSNIFIYNLHLFGTQNGADLSHCPKPIFINKSHHVWIVDNLIENDACEGIWASSTPSDTSDIYVIGNSFNAVGLSAAYGFSGLPAVQQNWSGGTVSNNNFINVGTGIGMATGSNSTGVTAIGNTFNGCANVCIGTGDGNPTNGAIIIGNTLTIDDSGANNTCILLANGTSQQQVNDNICTINATHSNNPKGILDQSNNSIVGGNTVIINSTSAPAFGFEFANGGGTLTATWRDNTCLVVQTGGAFIECFIASPNGNTTNITMQNNKVYGMDSSSFAYDCTQAGSGTLKCIMINNSKDSGAIRIDSPTSNAIELTITSGSANNVAYSYDNTAINPQLTPSPAVGLQGSVFASLPTPTSGTLAYITDGLGANCADTTCTTWGTTVSAGSGALKLMIWRNGTNWTLVGK